MNRKMSEARKILPRVLRKYDCNPVVVSVKVND
jgi:hypothetical protein